YRRHKILCAASDGRERGGEVGALDRRVLRVEEIGGEIERLRVQENGGGGLGRFEGRGHVSADRNGVAGGGSFPLCSLVGGLSGPPGPLRQEGGSMPVLHRVEV